jgi:predicted ATPase
MTGRFDLTRVRLRHYRSIAACDVRLGPLTFLVGPTGSGKSNFLDALRLTAQALTENLDNALLQRGGASEVRRRSWDHPSHFGVDVDFRDDSSNGSYSFQIAAASGGDYRVAREECEIWTQGARQHNFETRDGELISSTERVLPRGTSDRLYLVAASGLEAFRPVYDGLTSINVYNVRPEVMRHLQKPESGVLLRRDGANIASVLERLKRESPETKQRIEDYLSRVVDCVAGVDPQRLGSWETIEFRQHVAGDPRPWTFPATSMSDGTLRTLGVLCALLAGSHSSCSPVGIEALGATLHPAAAGLLLDALRDASATRQVLVTTHSPDLLDSPAINPAELLAVRAANGTTEIAPIDQAGQQAVREGLYTPGELLRVDQLIPDTPHTQVEPPR